MKYSFPLTQHFIFWCIHLTPTFLWCSLYLEVRKGGIIHTPKHCLRCRQWGEPPDPAQSPLDLLATPLLAPSTPKSCSSQDLGSEQTERPWQPTTGPIRSALQVSGHQNLSFLSRLTLQIWSKGRTWGKLPTTSPQPWPPELPPLPISQCLAHSLGENHAVGEGQLCGVLLLPVCDPEPLQASLSVIISTMGHISLIVVRLIDS